MTNFPIKPALERISPSLKAYLQEVNTPLPFIDVHTHIFNYKDVPKGFLGMRLPISSRRFLGYMAFVLHNLKPRTDRDQMSGYAYFIETLKNRTSERIFKRMIEKYYDNSSDFSKLYGILTMDMDLAIKGNTKRSIWKQLELIANLKKYKFPSFLPFANIDPTRGLEAEVLFRKAFEKNKGWDYFGLKVYPSLGYLPSHPTLLKMIKVCEKNNIPVLSHCSSALTKNTNRRLRKVPGVFVRDNKEHVQGPHDFKTGASLLIWRKARRDYRNFFNRPHNWIPVLEKFPNLKLNLAHFGGNIAWEGYCEANDKSKWVETIIELMHQYPNVYADFSFTMSYEKYSIALRKLMEKDPVVRSRVLFGSDYTLVITKGNYKQNLERFKQIMGPELIRQMAVINPNKHFFNL